MSSEDNDRHGTASPFGRGAVDQARATGYQEGRASVLEQLREFQRVHETRANQGATVGEWGDGIRKAQFIEQLIIALQQPW